MQFYIFPAVFCFTTAISFHTIKYWYNYTNYVITNAFSITLLACPNMHNAAQCIKNTLKFIKVLSCWIYFALYLIVFFIELKELQRNFETHRKLLVVGIFSLFFFYFAIIKISFRCQIFYHPCQYPVYRICYFQSLPI